jgi:hypothetical protein
MHHGYTNHCKSQDFFHSPPLRTNFTSWRAFSHQLRSKLLTDVQCLVHSLSPALAQSLRDRRLLVAIDKCVVTDFPGKEGRHSQCRLGHCECGRFLGGSREGVGCASLADLGRNGELVLN